MKKPAYRTFKLVLSDNDRTECLLRLRSLRDVLPINCLAAEDSVPDMGQPFPPGMRPITIRWGNGTSSDYFVYRERLLLRKNKAPIAQFFNDIGASEGTTLAVQQIGEFEFAISELVENLKGTA